MKFTWTVHQLPLIVHWNILLASLAWDFTRSQLRTDFSSWDEIVLVQASWAVSFTLSIALYDHVLWHLYLRYCHRSGRKFLLFSKLTYFTKGRNRILFLLFFSEVGLLDEAEFLLEGKLRSLEGWPWLWLLRRLLSVNLNKWCSKNRLLRLTLLSITFKLWRLGFKCRYLSKSSSWCRGVRVLLFKGTDLSQHIVLLLLIGRGSGKVRPIEGHAHDVHLLWRVLATGSVDGESFQDWRLIDELLTIRFQKWRLRRQVLEPDTSHDRCARD